MNILVTGCAGFIGSTLTEKLIEDNYVIGIDTFDDFYSKTIKKDNMKSFKNHKNFTFYEYDIRDKDLLQKLFMKHNIDVVVHLAAKPGTRTSFKNSAECVSVNVQGTVNLLDCISQCGVKKLVFASTSSVYENCSDEKYSETSHIDSLLSPYAQSKKTCEDYIRSYSAKFGIQSVILRFFTVFGPRQRPDLAICKFAKAIKNDETIFINGDGLSSRNYVYVDNVVDAVIAATNYDKTPFEIINIGSYESVTLNDLVKSLEKEIGKNAKLVYKKDVKDGSLVVRADISKAEKLLNYHPGVSFEEGLHKYIKSVL